MTQPIIIIGSGLAAYNLVREIRQRDETIKILMITENAGHFYSKPMLSTALSMGKTPESLMSMTSEKMAEQYKLSIFTHTKVTKIMPEQNSLLICKHEEKESPRDSLQYSHLIFCTGAEPYLPPINGKAKEDIFHINDIYEYALFREKIINKKKIILLGGGLVGCEFANDLSQAGYSVDVIELAKTPIAKLLPAYIGEKLQAALEKQGVQWHLGKKAQSIEKDHGLYCLTLEDGEKIEGDLVLSAIGLKPRIDLAKEAGITTHIGITVNSYLKTNIDNIYAMGDCAEMNGFILPYIAPIMQSAKALAATLTGEMTSLSLPAMAIGIKTSAYPLVVCQPPHLSDLSWEFEESEDHIRGYLKDKNHHLKGFILTHSITKERATLAQSLEKWL